MAEQMQIGEVADRTGLSHRTIRYYGEVDLVTPSSRTEGGFRLYTEADIAQLELVKKMKPLEYTLEEMREVLGVIAELEEDPPLDRREELRTQLASIRAVATARRDKLADKFAAAESFISQLDHHADRPRPPRHSAMPGSRA